MQDRDGARPLLILLANTCQRIALAWADGAYTGRLVDWARRGWVIALTVVKRNDDMTGFAVLPRRWVVERTLVPITRSSRSVMTGSLARLPASSVSGVLPAGARRSRC